MRLTFNRSLAYLSFYNKFCELGGHQILKKYLTNLELNNEIAFQLMVIIGNCAMMTPRMGVEHVLR